MLSGVQELLAQALAADDPAGALETLLPQAQGLTPAERSWLQTLDMEGLRLAGLLLQKLRFDLLLRGDRRLADEFRADPEAFTREFREYAKDVRATTSFAEQEARTFWQWRHSNGSRTRQSSGPART